MAESRLVVGGSSMGFDYSDEELKQMSVKTLNRLLGSGIYSGDEYKQISCIRTEKRMEKQQRAKSTIVNSSPQKKQRKNPFIDKIFTYLDRHPNTTASELTNIFDCKSFIAEQYLGRWKQEKRHKEEIKEMSQRYKTMNNSHQEQIKNLDYLQKENRNLENDKIFLQEQLRTSINILSRKQSWFSKLFKFVSKTKKISVVEK